MLIHLLLCPNAVCVSAQPFGLLSEVTSSAERGQPFRSCRIPKHTDKIPEKRFSPNVVLSHFQDKVLVLEDEVAALQSDVGSFGARERTMQV